jgi:hypothetical protein
LAALWPRAADDFLARYQVTAEPQWLGRVVLASASLKRKLLQAPVQIELVPDGLRLLVPGIVDDPEQLAFLFDLLSETARVLESAQAHPPHGETAAPARNLVEA